MSASIPSFGGKGNALPSYGGSDTAFGGIDYGERPTEIPFPNAPIDLSLANDDATGEPHNPYVTGHRSTR